MGEKGMDTGGMDAQISSVPVGQASDIQRMGDQLDNQRLPPEPPAGSSGPDAGEIVGDILDPLGFHKLFE